MLIDNPKKLSNSTKTVDRENSHKAFGSDNYSHKSAFTLSKKDIKQHVIIWILISILLCILDPLPGSWVVQLVGSVFIIGNYIWSYYTIALVVLPKFYKNNFLLLAFFTFLTYFVFFLIDYINFYYVIPFAGGINIYSDKGQLQILLDDIILGFLITLASWSLFFNRLSLERLRIQKEREKLLIAKELNFLKNQFNSHITFNFLNFCYHHVHQTSKKAAEAIEIFSSMLRYSLKSHPEEKVPLVKEIEYLENFIELQKLLSENVFVKFSFEGEVEGKLILPRVLVTIVENAFKHGIVNDPDKPIEILLISANNTLNLSVKNKKDNRKKLPKLGVGRENIQQTLDLFYGGQYAISINDTLENYSCILTLNLI